MMPEAWLRPMPDIDAFVVELSSAKARLLTNIERLRSAQTGAVAMGKDAQILTLIAAVRDIDDAIQKYRRLGSSRS